MKRSFWLQKAVLILASLALVGALACTTETVKEVPVKEIVIQEVIKEVPVEKIVEVEKVVVQTVEVEVPVEVIKEVIREVEKPGEVIVVTKEVVKEVPVEVVVTKEVVKIIEIEKAAVPSELRLGNGHDIGFLDVHRAQSGFDRFHGWMMFDTVLYFDPTMMNPDPGLARAWNISSDGLTYDLFLRDDVFYHNGDNFTATDMVWNYDRCIIELKVKSRCGNELQNMASYTATDDYSMRLTLKQFSVVFPTQLATTPSVMHRANVESGDMDTSPIGTGESHFVEYVPDDRLVLEKNLFYWNKGKLKIRPDRTVIIPIIEEQTRVAALKAGEVDVITGVSYQFIDGINKAPGVRIIGQRGGLTAAYWTIIMNTREGPMADVRVRKAMQLAVDKEAMNKAVFFGFGEVGCNPIPNNHWAYLPTVCPTRDLDAARVLLKEAGYDKDNPLKIKYMPEPGEIPRKMAEVLQQNVAEIDVEMEIIIVDIGAWLDTVWFGVDCDTEDWPASRCYAGIHKSYDLGDAGYSRTPDPDGLMQSVLRATTETSGWGGNNGMRYRNQRVEDLFDLGKGTTDRVVRKQYYAEIVDIMINQDVPLFKIITNPRFYGVSDRIQDSYISPKGYWNSRDYTFVP